MIIKKSSCNYKNLLFIYIKLSFIKKNKKFLIIFSLKKIILVYLKSKLYIFIEIKIQLKKN